MTTDMLWRLDTRRLDPEKKEPEHDVGSICTIQGMARIPVKRTHSSDSISSLSSSTSFLTLSSTSSTSGRISNGGGTDLEEGMLSKEPSTKEQDFTTRVLFHRALEYLGVHPCSGAGVGERRCTQALAHVETKGTDEGNPDDETLPGACSIGATTEETKPLLAINDTADSDDSFSSFSNIRRTIFPVHGKQEVTKFLLLGGIKFFIIMTLTLARDTKDTLIVTQCGAEAIVFLKIYGVLPAATAFIALYSKLSNVLGKHALFYTTYIPFFAFFLIFDMFLYPNVEILHPSLEKVQSLFPTATMSGGLETLTKIAANWTFALFYVMAEIYSSVSDGLLFWTFANDVVPVEQAKRLYPLFAQMSGLAPIVAGQFVVHYASKATNFGSSMHRLTGAMTFGGVMTCLLYKIASSFMERSEVPIVEDSSDHAAAVADAEGEGRPKKKKVKMTMVESAKFLASSQYLRLIATLVLGYGLSINFTEIMWKSLVKNQYPNPLDYQRFMGNFSSAVGLSSFLVIFFGVHVIRILGWKVGALATPGVMAVMAAPFFACILLGLDSPVCLSVAVFFGTIQSLLSKTTKYSLFDPTTQMAYIPLDEESKVKGKAAIDVLGSRIGKSGGSLIQQGLVFMFGSIINAAPVVAVIYYSVLFLWISGANRLSGLFDAQTKKVKARRKLEQSVLV